MLYTCGNQVFRSINGGHSWEAISPDLTRADMSKLGPSGGPITLDTSGAEHYATIYAFCESPHEPGAFMAGSDNGLVHISRNGGASWQNVTPPDLPEWSYIRTVEPSPFDPATWYVAATRYKLDDPAPYLYKTTDYGATWRAITDGIPADDYVRVIRCDPNRRGVLYMGTELGLYISFDDGASWRRWRSNLPVAPIYDMKIKNEDLVLATHGRGFWIGDNLTLLYQGLDAVHRESAGMTLFAPRRTYRILPDLFADWMPAEGKIYSVGLGSGATILARKTETGQLKRTFLDAGEGAPRGAVIDYFLPEAPAAETPVLLEILDEDGAPLRSYGRKPADYDQWDDKRKGLEPGPWLPLNAGMNRFVWNLRLPGATKVPGNKTAAAANEGPFVLPGRYQVRLRVGDWVETQTFEVVNDPCVQASMADLQEQFALLLRIRNKISAIHEAVNRLRSVREQVELWRKRAGDHPTIGAAATALLEKLASIEDALILPGDQKVTYSLIIRSRLNEALASVIPIVGSADAPPTEQTYAIVEHYSAQIDAQLSALETALSEDLAKLNQAIQEANLAPIEG